MLVLKRLVKTPHRKNGNLSNPSVEARILVLRVFHEAEKHNFFINRYCKPK